MLKKHQVKSTPTRIAIIDNDKCKPNKCNNECKLKCPVNRTGSKCVEVTKTSKNAIINANLCIGCNICTKVCPYEAIQIVNLPTQIESLLVYSYGENSFRLYKLPIPKMGQIMGCS